MLYIGSDHGGFDAKERLKQILEKKHLKYKDLGIQTKQPSDFPIIAEKIAKQVSKTNSKGILICTSGIGMSIAANKIKGIRAAKINNEQEAEMAKKHNNANIITFKGSLKTNKIKQILEAWMNTKFSKKSRYSRRNKQIKGMEK
ncbi:MAG: RpiB/LacA/LacB family sugar-phosphate isomerase [Nanobdellota archaeon]